VSVRNRIVDMSRPVIDLFAPPAPTTLIFGEPEVTGDRMLISVHEAAEGIGIAPAQAKALGSIEITPVSSDFYPVAGRRRWIALSLLLVALLATLLLRLARH
jgi:hypothetical protein